MGNIKNVGNAGMFKSLKKKILRYLDKLAEENEKTFGKRTLDCCQLNNNNGNKKK